jgi:hypothetical protein
VPARRRCRQERAGHQHVVHVRARVAEGDHGAPHSGLALDVARAHGREVVEHVESETAALEDILPHGGLNADTTVETSGFGDSVFVTECSATTLSRANDTESVSYVAGARAQGEEHRSAQRLEPQDMHRCAMEPRGKSRGGRVAG